MKASVLFACALTCALATPAGATAPTVAYAPPAGLLPAGRLRGGVYDAVLPSGRFVTPAGISAVTGVDALGLTLSPDGRFAIVGNDDASTAPARSSVDPAATGGSTLAVFDTATMTPVSRFAAPAGQTFLGGVVAARDPAEPDRTLVLVSGGPADAVYVFTLDAAGRLAPDARPSIPIPGPFDPAFADEGRSGPTSLAVSADGRRAYVVNGAGGSVATIDLRTRRLTGALRPVGYFPNSAAVAGGRLLVTNEGMMRYGVVAQRTAAPPFGTPQAALERASSLSLVDLSPGGTPVPAPPEGSGPSTVPMDPPADGLRIVGGAHPSALAVTPDDRDAYVAMTNVDRIATVALDAAPHVAGGTELRLFDRGPYGTQPCALALSRDGSRLYVALRGLDAVAVVDARDPLHLHRLGLIPTGWAPSALALASDDRTLFVLNQKGFGDDGTALWSTLERIDLAGVRLADSTRATLTATRSVVAAPAKVPAAIKNVVAIVIDRQTIDLASYGAATAAPNLHALAQRYAFAANFYSDANVAGIAQQVLISGIATAFAETKADAGEAVFGGVDDPEDAPRIGSVFEALARRELTFRDYGGFLAVAGFDGSTYGYDVPAPAVLAGHVDLDYPGPDPLIDDQRRAHAFERDYDALVASAATPRFAYVALQGTRVADTDAAVGALVEHLSHGIGWRSTAVIVISAGGAAGAADPAHAFALVISPYARRHFTGVRHLSTASVLKTVDGIFALPPLSLGDLLASGMNDYFTTVPDVRPFAALLPSPQ